MRRIESAAEQREDSVVETLEDLIRPVLARTKRSAPLAVQLDGAGLDMTAELWTLIRVGLSLVLATLAGVLSGSAATAIAVGIPLGFVAPQMWLKRRRRKRSRNFEEGLPDALMLMASSLRSGFSLDQAIVATSDQAENEVSTELRRAVQEIRIGSPLEAALDRIAERMDSSDFRWVVTALRIQRKSGGNLAELLITVSHTVRQRAQMSREVAALTAEGRLSAYVLIALPLVLFAFLMLTQPTYLEPLYKASVGLMLTAVGVAMLLIGWLLMKKLVQVDV
jgi:tight adherence protein B